MNIMISNTKGTPIYEQIYTQLKQAIICEELVEGEALPSIRGLAKDIRVSVITTKRAYDELEKDGFIHTVAGKGCFVAPKNMELIQETNRKKIEDLMEEIIKIAKMSQISMEELVEMMKLIGGEDI